MLKNMEQPKYPIDLGKKMDVSPMPVGGEKSSDEIFYPSLYLEWEKPYNFPDEGTMTVRFKKTEENTKKGGKPAQRVNLDILEILDTQAGKGETDEETAESTSDVLDREVKKIQKNKEAGNSYDAKFKKELSRHEKSVKQFANDGSMKAQEHLSQE